METALFILAIIGIGVFLGLSQMVPWTAEDKDHTVLWKIAVYYGALFVGLFGFFALLTWLSHFIRK